MTYDGNYYYDYNDYTNLGLVYNSKNRWQHSVLALAEKEMNVRKKENKKKKVNRAMCKGMFNLTVCTGRLHLLRLSMSFVSLGLVIIFIFVYEKEITSARVGVTNIMNWYGLMI